MKKNHLILIACGAAYFLVPAVKTAVNGIIQTVLGFFSKTTNNTNANTTPQGENMGG